VKSVLTRCPDNLLLAADDLPDIVREETRLPAEVQSYEPTFLASSTMRRKSSRLMLEGTEWSEEKM